jgi:predicted nucleic acid-binding protein
MRFLLDTSILSMVLRDDPTCERHVRMAAERGDDVVISVTVRGEALYGIGRLPAGRKRDDLAAKLHHVLARLRCMELTSAIADEYARLRIEQERTGALLDANDLWIAAAARAHDATLVTRDTDFARVAGLA